MIHKQHKIYLLVNILENGWCNRKMTCNYWSLTIICSHCVFDSNFLGPCFIIFGLIKYYQGLGNIRNAHTICKKIAICTHLIKNLNSVLIVWHIFIMCIDVSTHPSKTPCRLSGQSLICGLSYTNSPIDCTFVDWYCIVKIKYNGHILTWQGPVVIFCQALG